MHALSSFPAQYVWYQFVIADPSSGLTPLIACAQYPPGWTAFRSCPPGPL